MDEWIRFDELLPSQGQFLVAITQRDESLPVDDWEHDLEKNCVGCWIDGEIWEGDLNRRGFTHWFPLPDRPAAVSANPQLFFWN
jgi:hypothetical protein